MWNKGKGTIRLAILAFIQILGIISFCKGFFPYKIYLSGHSTKADQPLLFSNLHNEYKPEFDRLVFILIDALRNDFLFGNNSNFEFVNNQIKQGFAYPFTAKATAPTVTLPRIKAITTGTVPNFLDAILNIAESDTSSSLQNHDNWIYQFKRNSNNNNKTIHFFGDDTWIRLFPDLFDKKDGTTSFFVSDTTEVDLNVTRHIDIDLVQNDWDAIVFHYLGLDHIGHLGGPKSPLMKPKQKEMDQAIERIYDIIAKQDSERSKKGGDAKGGTLIVICGDHGMNEKGNHGGSSIGETSAGLVFLSPAFEAQPLKYQWELERSRTLGFPIVDQIDLVPTLATLFSFPIPKNNLGKIILELYQPHQQDVSHILRGLQLNAFQLAQLLTKLMPEVSKYITEPHLYTHETNPNSPGFYYAKAIDLHQTYLQTAFNNGKEEIGKRAIYSYYKFIDIAQSKLVNTASDYSLKLMLVGVTLICISAVQCILWVKETYSITSTDLWDVRKYFSIIAFITYSMSMFASSFVEKEHATWYYLLQTMILISIAHSLRLPHQKLKDKMYLVGFGFVYLMLTRIAMAWNDSITFEKLLHSKLQWHLMAITLAVASISGIRLLFKLKDNLTIDVNQTTHIIQTIIKAFLAFILLFTSALVFIYKMRGHEDIPNVYRFLLKWELVQSLDQVELGRLIFNYGGAGLFVLYCLFYVIKRAAKMKFEKEEEPKEYKTKIILELLLHLVTPFLVLLSGSHNAFLYCLFNLQFQLLLIWQDYVADKGPIPVWFMSVITVFQSHASFFITGHHNSIASFDLSNAYVGVQKYDTILIGFLTFFSNWSGSIWWAIAGWVLTEKTAKSWSTYLLTHSTLFSLVLTFLSISVTVLREHLFIWTVFSPKYLYQVAWTCLFHWFIQLILGSLFTQFIFKW
ncbi:alkaline-phosphatase-like protein [Cokeromyces recurvatus]|uniref:alkaline-phosphatase-like protein n=1 Tax=Cokeromyces recurvatus TaxID=90255 RepID=UPI00221FC9F8|nr:alkaline-phosphatase-like protein [Cokeromyces recurvatus]KAI7897734.1 alkaline-phosphatase-like protein [Cokeromyces recurvatus]